MADLQNRVSYPEDDLFSSIEKLVQDARRSGAHEALQKVWDALANQPAPINEVGQTYLPIEVVLHVVDEVQNAL